MLRKVMARAWEIYKSLVGDRLAKLSLAMKQAWKEIKEGAKSMESKYKHLTRDWAEKLLESVRMGEKLGFGYWKRTGIEVPNGVWIEMSKLLEEYAPTEYRGVILVDKQKIMAMTDKEAKELLSRI